MAEQNTALIMKFGGTSVATAKSWRAIASIVRARVAAGKRPILVCSALAGITDRLVELGGILGTAQSPARDLGVANQLARIDQQHDSLAEALGLDPVALLSDERGRLRDLVRGLEACAGVPPAQMAQLLSTGERLSTILGAAYLERIGLPTAWLDARTLLPAVEDDEVSEADRYLSAAVHCDPCDELAQRVADLEAPVVMTQGFVARRGCSETGETVVMGRGGSDTSAAALAARLRAPQLEVWSDVPGLFSANPSVVSDARLLSVATVAEARTLASRGAAVLHPRALEPIRRHGVTLRFGWTLRSELDATTLVVPDNTPEAETGIKAVTSRDNLCMLSLQRDPHWQPVGFMAEVAAVFRRHGLSMDLISSSPSDIRVTLDLDAFPSAEGRLDRLVADLERCSRPTLHRQVACLSLVGSGIRTHLDRLGLSFGVLDERRVYMITQSADDCSVNFVVDRAGIDDLVREIHERLFGGHHARTDAFGPTWDELMEERAQHVASAPMMGTDVPASPQAMEPNPA